MTYAWIFSRLSGLAAALLVVLAGAGCRYSMGSLAHPELASVRVGRVQNITAEPQLEVVANEELRREFTRDGSLTLADGPGADCVVEVRVVEVVDRRRGARRTSSTDTALETYRTLIYGLEITLEYRLLVPGREQPLLAPRRVTGKAEYADLADHAAMRRQAARLALADAAAKVVSGVTEGW